MQMTRTSTQAKAPCFAVILLSALAFAQSADAMSSSDSNPPTGASAVDFEVPRDKVHLSAQALQAIYLKRGVLFMQKAAGSAKEATCLLSLWFTGEGMIQAAQLLKASGFPLLDQACLQAALGRRFEGLPEGHSGGRTYFSIHWVFQLKPADVPQ
jgi:TonB family protein